VLNKLRELSEQDKAIPGCNAAADEQVAALDIREEQTVTYHSVDLHARGISEAQAADLRARLKTFAEDWERPEASVYDKAPAR